MKVFVTGVSGQLGHDVMLELEKRGYEAIGSDRAGDENASFEIKESFEGYLGYQDIDFYTLNVESKSTVPHDE